jgi:hypothetical protein
MRLILIVGGFRRATWRGRAGYLLLVVLILVGMGFAFYLIWQLLKLIRSPEINLLLGDLGPITAALPGFVVTAAFVGLFLTSFGFLLQALYLAGDMDFLLSSPVPIRAVFLAKMLQAVLPNFAFVLLFGLPVLYGLGYVGAYRWLYYPLVLLVLVAVASAAAGLASLIVMLVVRVFPARRIAEVLGLVVGVSSIICSQSGQLANFGDLSPAQTTQSFSALARFNSPLIPMYWSGQGLVAVGTGSWLTGIALVVATLLVCGGLFMVSLAAAEKLYYSGWAGMQGNLQRKKAPNKVRNRAASGRSHYWSFRVLPQAVQALLKKDLLVLRRDLRNLSQIITPLILGVVYTVMLVRGRANGTDASDAPIWFQDAINSLAVYANVGIAIFVAWMLLNRLGLVAFSQEGPSYWVLKSAPVSERRLLIGKYLLTALPAFILSGIFFVVISILRQTPTAAFLYGFLALSFCIAGASGVSLSFGVLGARFDWQDPRKMASGGAGCAGSIVVMGFLGVSFLLFAGPTLIAASIGWEPWLAQAVGLLLGGLFCLLAAAFPILTLSKRVAVFMEA